MPPLPVWPVGSPPPPGWGEDMVTFGDSPVRSTAWPGAPERGWRGQPFQAGGEAGSLIEGTVEPAPSPRGRGVGEEAPATGLGDMASSLSGVVSLGWRVEGGDLPGGLRGARPRGHARRTCHVALRFLKRPSTPNVTQLFEKVAHFVWCFCRARSTPIQKLPPGAISSHLYCILDFYTPNGVGESV
jgi:hypothetical protein